MQQIDTALFNDNVSSILMGSIFIIGFTKFMELLAMDPAQFLCCPHEGEDGCFAYIADGK